MSSRLLRLMVVGALLLVGGCANMGALNAPQATLLEEYQQIRSWSATQTEVALREREQLQLQTPSEINRVRLALVLGFGRGAATDPKRALQLFDESSKKVDGRPSSVALFAEVFAGILKERLQAETRISAAEAKTGAAETKVSAAEAKINALSREAESERERANELEKKLEALKSIEKSLHKR